MGQAQVSWMELAAGTHKAPHTCSSKGLQEGRAVQGWMWIELSQQETSCLAYMRPWAASALQRKEKRLGMDEELSRAQKVRKEKRDPTWGHLGKVTKHGHLWSSRNGRAKVVVQP